MQLDEFLPFKILFRKQTLIQDQRFGVIGCLKLRKKNNNLRFATSARQFFVKLLSNVHTY